MAEPRQTNNPNATPTATDRPVATTKTQEQKAREAAARGTTMEDLQALFGGQLDLLKQAQQGQVNPVTGSRTMTRRTMSGAIEDPNAPTGLAWFDAFGPDRPSVQARLDRLNSERSMIPAGMPEKIESMKTAQRASGNRNAFDDSTPVNRAGQVMQTPGSDVRVAYDANGMPVGFSGATANMQMPQVAGNAGGFSSAEQDKIRSTANQLAANQVMAAFGDPQGEVIVGPTEPAPTTASAEPSYTPLVFGAPSLSETVRKAVQGYQQHGALDSLQAGVQRMLKGAEKLSEPVGEWIANFLNLNPNIAASPNPSGGKTNPTYIPTPNLPSTPASEAYGPPAPPVIERVPVPIWPVGVPPQYAK